METMPSGSNKVRVKQKPNDDSKDNVNLGIIYYFSHIVIEADVIQGEDVDEEVRVKRYRKFKYLPF